MLAPNIEKLVGTWELREPLPPAPVQLQLALDTRTPPRDVTSFLVSGTAAGVEYDGLLSAALDGLMVLTKLSDAPTGSSASEVFAQTYLTRLRAVVQFGYTADNRLRLSYGSSQPGTLVYERK